MNAVVNLAFFPELRLEMISGKHIHDYLDSQERRHLTPDRFRAGWFLWTRLKSGRMTDVPWHQWTLNMALQVQMPAAWVVSVSSAFQAATGETLSYRLKGLGLRDQKYSSVTYLSSTMLH